MVDIHKDHITTPYIFYQIFNMTKVFVYKKCSYVYLLGDNCEYISRVDFDQFNANKSKKGSHVTMNLILNVRIMSYNNNNMYNSCWITDRDNSIILPRGTVAILFAFSPLS